MGAYLVEQIPNLADYLKRYESRCEQEGGRRKAPLTIPAVTPATPADVRPDAARLLTPWAAIFAAAADAALLETVVANAGPIDWPRLASRRRRRRALV
jgi:hypothetical protein